jgi:uncharacterized RDD family membrane protein YckC
MRCPKCQYVGFEPSPRCKNCGYELSLGSDTEAPPTLTLVSEPDTEAPMADFDLQIFDDVPAKRVQSGAQPFDLDDLLANGPSSGGERESAPVIAAVSEVARRRQSNAASASASSFSSSSARSISSSASAVATPPPMEVEALFKPEISKPAAAIERAVVEPAAVEPAVVLKPMAAPLPPPAPPAPAPVTTELPLFMQGMSPVVQAPVPATIEAAADAIISEPEALQPAADLEIDDRPLVKVPASPRAPLAVRRTTPDPARLRAKYGKAARSKADTEVSGDLLLESNQQDARTEPKIVPPAQRLSAEPTPTSLPAEWLPGVSPAKRLTAAALDGALLLALDAAVIWFTLSVCGLATTQVKLLPIAPLLLFFLLLDAGYLVLFTAACGQTLGKMAAGIRVVGTTTGAVINDRITIAQAVTRSFASIASMLPLGAGFWFGLVGDRRAAHDRVAHTRVIAQ